MGYLGKTLKSAIVLKLVNEARKPHNQQKIKNMVSSLRSKGTSTTSPRVPRH